MALDQWIADGTLTLPVSCDGGIDAHPSVQAGDTIVICDTDETGGSVHIDCPLYEDATYRTILVVKSTTHPLRLNLGGALGAPRLAGVFAENILAGDGDFIRIDFPPFTEAEVLLVLVQPGD